MIDDDLSVRQPNAPERGGDDRAAVKSTKANSDEPTPCPRRQTCWHCDPDNHRAIQTDPDVEALVQILSRLIRRCAAVLPRDAPPVGPALVLNDVTQAAPDEAPWLTMAGAAELLNCSVSLVRNLVNNGGLESRRLGKAAIRVSRTSVLTLASLPSARRAPTMVAPDPPFAVSALVYPQVHRRRPAPSPFSVHTTPVAVKRSFRATSANQPVKREDNPVPEGVAPRESREDRPVNYRRKPDPELDAVIPYRTVVPLLSIPAAARLLGVSRSTVWSRVKNGSLESRTSALGNRTVALVPLAAVLPADDPDVREARAALADYDAMRSVSTRTRPRGAMEEGRGPAEST
jgi:excisionase family DNA binding protein